MATPEELERRHIAAEKRRLASEAREMKRLEKEKAKPKSKSYLWYMVFFLCLVYIVDEVATGVHNGIVDLVNVEFFVNGLGLTFLQGQGNFSLMETAANVFLVIGFFYKALADRFGRKPFLIANTIGMVGGLILCLWSQNLVVYILGFCLIRFFVTPDEQIVYIFESAPKEKRASIYSAVKGISELGLLLIPLGRIIFVNAGGSTIWRLVFLIPAIIGAVVSFCLCFLARETDPFIDSRMAYLKQTRRTFKNRPREERPVQETRRLFRRYQIWLEWQATSLDLHRHSAFHLLASHYELLHTHPYDL